MHIPVEDVFCAPPCHKFYLVDDVSFSVELVDLADLDEVEVSARLSWLLMLQACEQSLGIVREVWDRPE